MASKQHERVATTSFSSELHAPMITRHNPHDIRNAQEGFGTCGWILVFLSYVLCILSLPFSLCMTVKVVQEYERAVIMRLGRILSGGAKGPGLFFVLPCVDSIIKVDLRTSECFVIRENLFRFLSQVTFDVPPQEILTRDSVVCKQS
jgi:erythrocyte band 7 integral membrane protein